MKKSEMEAHAVSYDAAMARAREAERAGLYRLAVSTALAACKHADGMMRHQKKYADREFDSISAIDFVLGLAPLLMDTESINAVGSILKDARRIERNTEVDEARQLDQARLLIGKCHRLWEHLELNPFTLQSSLQSELGGDQLEWRRIAEVWHRMGVIEHLADGNSYRLTLSTQMDAVAHAKCTDCGSVARAPKATFLDVMTCPECTATVPFVILSASLNAE